MSKNSVLKKFSISTLANFLVLLVSIFSTLVFPKILNIEDYSYWQIYVFYTGFVTIVGLGWIEGIYLKNGGKHYDSLNQSIYSFQTYGLSVFVSVVFAIIGIIAWFFISDRKLAAVAVLVCVEGAIFNLRVYPLYLLQATDRIKDFSISIVVGRGAFFIAALVLILLKQADLYLFILSDILGCICCSFYAFAKCRNKLLGKPCGFAQGVSEAKNNISVGFSLMAANMVGIAITGVIKYAVQTHWSVVEFGKIALSITCTGLFLKFTTAVGTVLFPMLCNYSIEKLKRIYASVNTLLEYAIAGVMIFYYPAKLVLSMYLPQYAESLEYMGYLLPICLFETKVSLLLNTYYKAMRKEKVLMVVNLIDLGLSVVLAVLSTVLFSNIELAVFSILIVLAVRSVVLEIILCNKYLKLKDKFSWMFSILIAVAFVITNGFIGGWSGLLVYSIFVVFALLLGYRKIKSGMEIFLRRKSNEQ